MPKKQKNLDLRSARHADDGQYLDFVNETPEAGASEAHFRPGQFHECYNEAFRNRPLFGFEKR